MLTSDGVVVSTRTPQGFKDYEAKAVIVAIPPWLAGAISYTSGVPGQPNATGIRAKPGPGQAIHGYRE
jgi:monoamine oxidase